MLQQTNQHNATYKFRIDNANIARCTLTLFGRQSQYMIVISFELVVQYHSMFARIKQDEREFGVQNNSREQLKGAATTEGEKQRE